MIKTVKYIPIIDVFFVRTCGLKESDCVALGPIHA
jgi:hypothetical protein